MASQRYSTGRYGIVDPFYRHIWLNVWDEEVAHMIREVFWAKTTSLIFDLEQFSNFTESTVDSDVCLNWKIPVAIGESSIPSPSIHFSRILLTQSNYSSGQLINELTHSHLPVDLQLDLQQQMLLYWSLLIRYQNITSGLIDNSTVYADFNPINEIFQNTLHLDEIKSRLYDLVGQIEEDKFRISWAILTELDCLYE